MSIYSNSNNSKKELKTKSRFTEAAAASIVDAAGSILEREAAVDWLNSKGETRT